MKFYPYKDNFIVYQDYKYKYLIGIYSDVLLISIYLPRGLVCKFLFKAGLEYQVLENKIKYPVTISPVIVTGLYIIQKNWIKKFNIKNYHELSNNHQA